MLKQISVRGTPAEVAAQISDRYGDQANRVCVYMPYETPDDLWADLITAIKAS